VIDYYYEDQGKLHRVDSELAPDEVFKQVRKILSGDEEAAARAAEKEEKEQAERETKYPYGFFIYGYFLLF
jgi:hypothetical protein